MAMKLGGGDAEDVGEIADINVTPFIDVILVLLIIFMVAAPLSTVDVAVNLPTSNAPPQQRPPEPIFLSVTRDLGLKLGESAVPREELGAALDAKSGSNKDERIFLRADSGVAYGDLMGVMNLLRSAGYLKIALVGLEDPQGTVPGRPASRSGASPADPAGP